MPGGTRCRGTRCRGNSMPGNSVPGSLDAGEAGSGWSGRRTDRAVSAAEIDVQPFHEQRHAGSHPQSLFDCQMRVNERMPKRQEPKMTATGRSQPGPQRFRRSIIASHGNVAGPRRTGAFFDVRRRDWSQPAARVPAKYQGWPPAGSLKGSPLAYAQALDPDRRHDRDRRDRRGLCHERGSRGRCVPRPHLAGRASRSARHAGHARHAGRAAGHSG